MRPHGVVPKGSAPEPEPCIAVPVPARLWDMQDPHGEADTHPGLGALNPPGESSHRSTAAAPHPHHCAQHRAPLLPSCEDAEFK